jgi:hypothetical protein
MESIRATIPHIRFTGLKIFNFAYHHTHTPSYDAHRATDEEPAR